MKRKVWMHIFICVIAMCLTLISFSRARQYNNNDKRFTMPASLKYIDKEAFEGTSVQTVVLSPSTVYVGEKAFADNSNLKAAVIYAGTEYICEDTFQDADDDFILFGELGSYAQGWALHREIQFLSIRCFALHYHSNLVRIILKKHLMLAWLILGLIILTAFFTRKKAQFQIHYRKKYVDLIAFYGFP